MTDAAVFNPRMLILARESRGLTQSELARRLGISQARISKIEGGVTEPDSDFLGRCSEELGYPVSFFNQSDAVKSMPLPFYRKQKTTPVKKLKTLVARANVARIHLERLLLSADVPECRVPFIDAEDIGTAADVARELRVRWHLPPGPIENMTELLEGNGVVLIPFDFGTEKVDAASIHDATDTLPPVVLVSRTAPGDRLRWTLAHELGHLIMHNHRAMPGRDCEPEADEFAGEFLMPRSEIRPQLRDLTLRRAAQLKRVWRVSMQAIVMHAERLGAISERKKRYLFTMINKHGWRRSEPVTIGREEPTLLSELIGFHFNDLGYTEDELACALSTVVVELRSNYLAGTRGLRVVK